MSDKTCPHGEQFVACDKCDLAEAREEIKALLSELDEASPMRTCARCGKQDRAHRMAIEEGDEWECPTCWERCEAQERAERALCHNCGTRLPEGCSGAFKADDGDACLLNRAVERQTLLSENKSERSVTEENKK
jgi:hypothetical protein